MTSKAFIVCEILLAVCGLALLVLRLASWDGSTRAVVSVIISALMFLCGAVAAVLALRLRHRERQRQRQRQLRQSSVGRTSPTAKRSGRSSGQVRRAGR